MYSIIYACNFSISTDSVVIVHVRSHCSELVYSPGFRWSCWTRVRFMSLSEMRSVAFAVGRFLAISLLLSFLFLLLHFLISLLESVAFKMEHQ